ncbi:Retrotransposon protein, Ty3-gypsy subclass, partial [Phytophthora megakarya]
AVYAILEAEAQAFKTEDQERPVTIFIDNGSSLNGVTEELVKKLELEVTEGTFQVMPVPEGKDIVLGMMWLREQNPDIDWSTGRVSPRISAENTSTVKLRLPKNRPARWVAGQRRARVAHGREIFNYYRQHGHKGEHGRTSIITSKQFEHMLRRDKDIEAIFVVNPHDSEKAERFKSQGWDALKNNPAYKTLRKYADTVFRTELPNETPPVREGIEHEVQLKPGTIPISVKQWRQSPDQRRTIQEWTKEMVQAGIIRPIGWRIVHDYRQLNSATVLPAIPMPRKEDTFDAMAGSYWFSCMDLLWGYYQVKLRESDIPFTAFSTPDGLYEYLVTPMGLSGSPGTFNRLLQKVFRDLRDVMRIYFDDIYVYTKSEDVDEHIAALDRVLKRCEEQKLYIKLSKCQFCVDEIPCLGDFVGRKGVRMDPDKVKIIAEWPVPKTKKQMESFLGTTVYVSRFCKDFAQFAGPLHECIKGKRQREAIVLDEDQLRCFDELKKRLSSPPVLNLPDFSKPFGIRMDASNFAIGGVLFQKEGELEHPIAFTGRKMKPAELNYPVREQELLAIMHALKTWRVYLLDKPFMVETDHKSIEMILTQKTANRRIARWFNELAEFQPMFKWIPGLSNTIADAMSRNPEFEHKAAQVSLQELLDTAQNREIVATMVANNMTAAQSAKKMYSWNKDVSRIVKKLQLGDKIPHYSINEGVLYYQTGEDESPRLYIPDDEDLKNRVICENHDAVSAGHPGFYKTYVAVREKCNVFMKNYVKDHGLPKTIVSDRDTKFTSKLWQAIIAAMGTQHNLSSAFRPQTDGQTERTNRFIGDYLRGVINPAQSNWDEFLHLAEIAYNRRVHSTIGMSPFEADLGYIPYMPDDVAADPEFEKLEKAAKEFLLRQEVFLKAAQDCMSEAQERMKYYYDRNRLVQDFNIGDMVLLDGKNLDIRHKGYAQSKKLAPRFIGPFPVRKKVSQDSYELGLSKGLKLHPVFHTSLLKPYRKDTARTQKVNKVVLADGTEGQLVEAVINHRKYKGKPQYKIWWLGETKKDATWEPIENLNQIPGLIDLYWQSKKRPNPFLN